VSLESPEEAADLAGLARRSRLEGPLDVLVRLNPAVRPETHHGLAVGAAGSKFGVLPEDLPRVVDAGGGTDGPLRWRGIHVHVGSQLGAVDAWRSAFRVALATLALQRAGLPDIDTVDIGSGFPVDDDPATVPSPARFAEEADAVLAETPLDARPSRLAIEPGRAVVARAGSLVARVLHVRDGEPRIVVLDAGMTELIRPALYGARHPIRALTSEGRPVDGRDDRWSAATVDGPVCESTDRFGDAMLPPLARGDLVAIGLTGAYGSSMASNYNGRPRAAEIAWDGTGMMVLRDRARIAALP
jgi:diaminopimelate decarboxylase